jgi:hypothetical protein
MPGFKDEFPFAVEEEWNAATCAYVRDIARASSLKVTRAALEAGFITPADLDRGKS